MLSVSVSASKCVTEPAFEVGRLVASPIANTFGGRLRLQRVRVGRDEARVVAEARRAIDERGAGVQRDRHEQVERLLALVVAAEHARARRRPRRR